MKWRALASIVAGVVLFVILLVTSQDAPNASPNQQRRNLVQVSESKEAKVEYNKSKLEEGSEDSFEDFGDPIGEDYTVTHWDPDWLNETDLGLVLKKRKKAIHRRCNLEEIDAKQPWRTVGAQTRITIRKAFVDGNPPLEYLYTAKAGSTFVGRLMARLRRRRKGQKSKGNKVVFTTIRNPWHRLVSVYLQKFTENADYKISGNFCPISKRKYTTFAMFVRQCVIGPAYSLLSNAHWYPTVYRNNICNTKINYIIALENMNPELEYMLAKEEIEEEEASKVITKTRTATIRRVEKKKASKEYQDYYKSLTRHELNKLREMWQDEIYILGYPDSPFIDSPYG